MISNVTLMFINLQLCEIFGTTDSFGRKYIFCLEICFGASPCKRTISIRENVSIRNSQVFRYHGWIWFVEIVRLRQRCDNTYRDILSGIQIGLIMDSDINVLQSKKIHFKGSSCNKRLNLHLYKSITSWYNIFTHVLFVQGFKHGNAQ